MEDSDPEVAPEEDYVGSQGISLTGALAAGLDLDDYHIGAGDGRAVVHLVFCP